MIGKITVALIAAILLSSVGVASAQVGRTGPAYNPYYGILLQLLLQWSLLEGHSERSAV
jgi:hypothetical protein